MFYFKQQKGHCVLLTVANSIPCFVGCGKSLGEAASDIHTTFEIFDGIILEGDVNVLCNLTEDVCA